MKARRARAINTEGVFDRAVYSSLDWPLKTVRLERDSLEDFNQRIATPHFCLAEVYHESSKLFPAMLEELIATRVNPDDIRTEFLRRRRTLMAGLAQQQHADSRVPILLTAIRKACPAELFYAIELRIYDGRRLWFHEPLSDSSYVLQELTPEDRRRLASALDIECSNARPVLSGTLIFLVGSLARNDLLYGARGYRRTLLEAGRITEVALRESACTGIIARARLEFFDRTVDSVLESDGIEESVLAVIDLEGPNAG